MNYKDWSPEIQQQIEYQRLTLGTTLMCAFINKYGTCKTIQYEVKPTDFDYEWRCFYEKASLLEIQQDSNLFKIHQNLNAMKSTKQFQETIREYNALTTLPPDEAMLIMTIDGNNIEFVFAPKIKQP